MSISLKEAALVVEGALARAHELDLAPMTVAVLDAGGYLVAFQREDLSGLLRGDIAFGKAWGSLGMGFNSREIGVRSAVAPAFYGALNSISQGRLVPGPGGMLILDAAGRVLGAVGISGDKPDLDEDCARAGIARAGLVAKEAPPAH